MDFITFVVGAFQSLLESVFTLAEDFFCVSWKYLLFLSRLYAGAFIAFLPYPFFFLQKLYSASFELIVFNDFGDS